MTAPTRIGEERPCGTVRPVGMIERSDEEGNVTAFAPEEELAFAVSVLREKFPEIDRQRFLPVLDRIVKAAIRLGLEGASPTDPLGLIDEVLVGLMSRHDERKRRLKLRFEAGTAEWNEIEEVMESAFGIGQMVERGATLEKSAAVPGGSMRH